MNSCRARSASNRTPHIPTMGIVFLAGFACSTADHTEVAVLLPENVGEWTRQETPVTYDRETIFDYINGAGEVYRSYAFADVQVASYGRAAGPAVTVEVFDMGTAEDAFGVFSYAREQEETGIGAGYERKGRILCFWQDRFYVCVAAAPGDDDAGDALEDMARAISAELPPGGERPALVAALPPDGLVPFSDRFFHTHQSLNYHYYLDRENILALDEETDVVLARYRPGPAYLLIIQYGSENDAARALESLGTFYAAASGSADVTQTPEGKWVASANNGRIAVVVLDADSEAAAVALRDAAMQELPQLEIED